MKDGCLPLSIREDFQEGTALADARLRLLLLYQDGSMSQGL